MISREEDFFSGLYETRQSKLIVTVPSLLLTPLLFCLVYGIVWYEKYGMDNARRTLKNQLITSLAGYLTIWIFTIGVPWYIRLLGGGPLSIFVCYSVQVWSNSAFLQVQYLDRILSQNIISLIIFSQ